jgi:predicted nucleic acid-binding protein
MRPAIAPAVAACLQAQDLETLFTASLREAEIRYGIARRPSPRRTRWAFRSFLAEGFAARVIAFESTCAEGYAAVRVRRESAGPPVSIPDAMIAGTALAHGATVVTRNVADFSGYGIAVANPWDGA